MTKTATIREDYIKREFILGCDYGNYPQPLRGLLEQRKEIYKTCYVSYAEADFKQVVQYIEDK